MATKLDYEGYWGLTGQLFELARQLRQRGGYPFNHTQLEDLLQNAIEGEFPDPIYPIVRGRYPDFGSLLAAGNFDRHDQKITERNFALCTTQIDIVGVRLVYIPGMIDMQEVWPKLKQLGLEQPITDDALIFAAMHPKVQRRRSIIFPHEPRVIWNDQMKYEEQGRWVLKLGNRIESNGKETTSLRTVETAFFSENARYGDYIFAGICRLDEHPLASWIS